MTAYWLYLLKVSMCIVVFYTFYSVVLRNSTFFVLNRLYLISGLLLSFIIPVLDLSLFKSPSDSVLSDIIPLFLTEPEYEIFQPQNLPHHVTTINYSAILPVIYFTGIALLFFKLLFSIIRIIRIRNNSATNYAGRKKVIRTISGSPFSFFTMIFLPEGENNPMVISHEMAHIRQYHWLDLILLEAASLLLWFNPLLILYKKSLKLQHEYLADASVIKREKQVEEYLYCMLKQVQAVSYGSITSQFSCKTIKKRIVMITKNKTSYKYLAVYSFIVPLTAFMLFAFAGNKTVLAQNREISQNSAIQPSIYPVDSEKIRRISAGYGERINPKTKKKNFHYGMDFALKEGEKVVSTADGVVVDAKFDPRKGNYVIVRHNETFSTFYSHLKNTTVQAGDKLAKGEVIGYSGNTGLSTGPHLHYEVIKDGERVNPEDYLPE